jgi:hypothetical protein
MSANDEVADVLRQLIARLDRLEQKVDSLTVTSERTTAVLDRIPVVAEAAGQTAQWLFDEATADGVDPIALGEQAAALGRKAARPEMLALADRLVGRSGDLTFLLDQMDGLDRKLSEVGVSRAALAQAGIDVAARLAQASQSKEATALVANGPLDREALDVLGKASRAMVEVRRQPVEPMGLFGTLRAMGDADVQRAVGFTFAIARRFGQLLVG